MASRRPIGFFDSGVGGLSVVKEVQGLMPSEDILYFADSAWAPYGGRRETDVRGRCALIARELVQRDCKALVIACNTATAAAASSLRQIYRIPVVGMEPAVKPAVQATRNNRVGVLATVGTLKSARFAALLERFQKEVHVVTQPCPGLVELVERGEFDAPETSALCEKYCQPLMEAGVDVVVLGCTHYPWLRGILASIFGPEVSLIETGRAVAERLAARLEFSKLRSDRINTGSLVVYTTGSADHTQALLRIMQLNGSVESMHRLS